MSLCTLQKGSLTVEAALVLPFFLFMLLAFFDLFGQYVQAAELQMEAAAEAKTVGIVKGAAGSVSSGRIVIVKSRTADRIVKVPFRTQERIFARAVCRAWIGFRGREDEEVYVYITPDGEVYHLYADCTHLELSIRQAPFDYAVKAKNVYGEKYRQCGLCREKFGSRVYITEEGDCYHSERTCSGLKRTVLSVPISEAEGRGCCLRCMERGEVQ